MYTTSSTQQPAAICALKSPADAIHILEAVRLGLVPRVTRRLTGQERSMIRPGTIWVWEEEETNMRRWTDGRRWGASRVGGGGFLVYTESTDRQSPPSSNPGSPSHYAPQQFNPGSKKHSESLVKQTYSTSMTHPGTGKVKKFHVVAYSSKHNPQGDAHNPLPLPHQLPLLANLKITPGIWPEWEHRREADYARRQVPQLAHSHHHNQPHPSHHHHVQQSSSASALNTPESLAYAPRQPSPNQSQNYGPRPGQDAGMMPRYDAAPYNSPYYPPPPRDPYAQYGNRNMAQPPNHSTDRFHPYHNPDRSRPPPQAGYPTAASSGSSSALPPTPTTAQGDYYDPRGVTGTSPPGIPFHQQYRPNPYGYPTEPYDHRATQYPMDPNVQPMMNPWDPKQPQLDQSQVSHSQPQPQQAEPRRIPSNHHIRTPSTPSHLVPPSDQGNTNASGKSPKMSIGSTLLNPHKRELSAPGGITLPPLRMGSGDGEGNGNGHKNGSGSDTGSIAESLQAAEAGKPLIS